MLQLRIELFCLGGAPDAAVPELGITHARKIASHIRIALTLLRLHRTLLERTDPYPPQRAENAALKSFLVAESRKI